MVVLATRVCLDARVQHSKLYGACDAELWSSGERRIMMAQRHAANRANPATEHEQNSKLEVIFMRRLYEEWPDYIMPMRNVNKYEIYFDDMTSAGNSQPLKLQLVLSTRFDELKWNANREGGRLDQCNKAFCASFDHIFAPKIEPKCLVYPPASDGASATSIYLLALHRQVHFELVFIARIYTVLRNAQITNRYVFYFIYLNGEQTKKQNT